MCKYCHSPFGAVISNDSRRTVLARWAENVWCGANISPFISSPALRCTNLATWRLVTISATPTYQIIDTKLQFPNSTCSHQTNVADNPQTSRSNAIWPQRMTSAQKIRKDPIKSNSCSPCNQSSAEDDCNILVSFKQTLVSLAIRSRSSLRFKVWKKASTISPSKEAMKEKKEKEEGSATHGSHCPVVSLSVARGQ